MAVIANVTAATTITAAWGNSVADEINAANPTTLKNRVDHAWGYGESILKSDTTPGFAAGTAFRIAGTDFTTTRPAWATGVGLVDVTTMIRYTTDASAANAIAHVGYRVNATGAWNYISENYAGGIYLPGGTITGFCVCRYVFSIAGGETLQVSVAGRQTAGAGSLSVALSAMSGVVTWAV